MMEQQPSTSSLLNLNYLTHPAYKPHYKSADIESHFPLAVEKVCQSFDSMTTIKTVKELENHFQTEAQKSLAQLQEIMLRHLTDNQARSAALGALEKTSQDLYHRNLLRLTSRSDQNKSTATSPPLDHLKEKRFSLTQVNSQSIKTMREDLDPYIQQIKASSDRLQFNYRDIPLPMRGAFWSEAIKAIHNAGFLSAASQFLGYQVEPWYCALGYAKSSDTWWHSPYSDIGLPTSDLTYLHVDKGYDIVKCIIYLDEVTEENGPFSYFTGPPDERMKFQDQFYCYLDYEWVKRYKPDLPNPKQYYRKHCLSPKFREEFVNLPQFFRGSSHFGDDILNGSELSQSLLKNENKVTSDLGNCFLFFGSDLLHRGGMVKKGERLALQLGFLQKRPFYKDLKKKAINSAYQVLGDKTFRTVKSYLRS